MIHGNPPEYYEKAVNGFSEDALKAFEIFGCHGHFPCLPVDRNRILFVTCKKSYENKKHTYCGCNNEYASTYGSEFLGNNKVLMRCPNDCAVRGAAFDGGKRYNEIKERTIHIKFTRPIVEIIRVSIIQRILSWFREILS